MEQVPHTAVPHFLQWCYLSITEKSVSQIKHERIPGSTHMGLCVFLNERDHPWYILYFSLSCRSSRSILILSFTYFILLSLSWKIRVKLQSLMFSNIWPCRKMKYLCLGLNSNSSNYSKWFSAWSWSRNSFRLSSESRAKNLFEVPRTSSIIWCLFFLSSISTKIQPYLRINPVPMVAELLYLILISSWLRLPPQKAFK